MPTSTSPTVLILGGTGQLGSLVAKKCLLDEKHSVRLLVRNPDKAPPEIRASPSVEVIVGNMASPNDMKKATNGISKMVSIVPDCPNQVELERVMYQAVKAAAESKNSHIHIVKTSTILAGASPPRSFGALHHQGEKLLEAAASESLLLDSTILRPAFFLQTLERFQEPVVKLGKIAMPCQDGAVAFVDLEDIADSIVEVLSEQSQTHLGRIYTLTGSQAWKLSEVADKLSTTMNKPVTHVSPPTWLSYWIFRFFAGMDAWTAEKLVELFVATAEGWESHISNDVATLKGSPARSLDEYLERQTVFQL